MTRWRGEDVSLQTGGKMTFPNSTDDRSRSSYYGEPPAPNLMFNANLQEFSQRVGLICTLEANGQIASEEAYRQIKNLWKALKASKRELFERNG